MCVRVLIVDDSAFVRDVLRHHLECMGCEVVAEAENTLQALALFRTVSPSLVILDVAVPQTAGIGAQSMVRIMRSENPMVQVLAMGALAFSEVRKSFVSEGAFDYLIKPLDAQAFNHVRNQLEELFPELSRARLSSSNRIGRPTASERRPTLVR
jgi:two-component system, chemotaxis family, chemotaxis protein CheY